MKCDLLAQVVLFFYVLCTVIVCEDVIIYWVVEGKRHLSSGCLLANKF